MLFDHKLAWTDEKIYNEIYKNSVLNPNGFWMHHSKIISWQKEPTSACSPETNVCLDGGISNVCYNCVDRHAIRTPEKTAILWHGDEIEDRRELSYKELLKLVVEIASLLRSNGVKKGDVVGVYMPMRIESIAVMMACARIGALHMVIFAGFSANALSYRLEMSNVNIICSFGSARRGGRVIDLTANVNEAILKMSYVPKVLMFDEYESLLEDVVIDDSIEWCDNKDNLFILYTSGSTGKPKGIVHSSLRYMLYSAVTFKFVFDIREDDVYFCTSDIGWITGHSYIAYAPFFHGTTVVIFEGNPTYPTASRYRKIIEREKVSIFYKAPTAIRSLQLFNKSFVKNHDLSSLRILGTVGEPINKDAWKWYFEVVGNKRCPIVDTWWQTETGGIMLAPLLDIKSQKPGYAAKPFFGITPKIIDNSENVIDLPNIQGNLYIENNWPGMCKSVAYECEYSEKDVGKLSCQKTFEKEYFVNGMFKTGDGAVYDKDFDIKIIGRLDDVINISGHRLSTAEFEDSIHNVFEVKECAVVAVEHDIKGQAAFVYVVTEKSTNKNETIKSILSSIRKSIGCIAKPDFIAFVDDLPKTRSGKIVRHLLRDLAQNKQCDSKDLSSVSNIDCVSKIKEAVYEAFACPDVCAINTGKKI